MQQGLPAPVKSLGIIERRLRINFCSCSLLGRLLEWSATEASWGNGSAVADCPRPNSFIMLLARCGSLPRQPMGVQVWLDCLCCLLEHPGNEAWRGGESSSRCGEKAVTLTCMTVQWYTFGSGFACTALSMFGHSM